MTNKQLYNELVKQQKRILDIDGFYMSLSVFNTKESSNNTWFSINIQNINNVIFSDNYEIADYKLNEKLDNLRKLINNLICVN